MKLIVLSKKQLAPSSLQLGLSPKQLDLIKKHFGLCKMQLAPTNKDLVPSSFQLKLYKKHPSLSPLQPRLSLM